MFKTFIRDYYLVMRACGILCHLRFLPIFAQICGWSSVHVHISRLLAPHPISWKKQICLENVKKLDCWNLTFVDHLSLSYCIEYKCHVDSEIFLTVSEILTKDQGSMLNWSKSQPWVSPLNQHILSDTLGLVSIIYYLLRLVWYHFYLWILALKAVEK